MAETRSVTCGECTLHVRVHAPADDQPRRWVLLLHGFPDTAEMWEPQAAALSASGFSVIAPDMPGFGRSSFAAPDALPSYRMRHVAGVMCSMLQQLGLRGQPVTVVGHDWGAAVAWTLAITAPQVVQRLVVLSVGHPGGARDAQQLARWWYQLFFCLPDAEEAVMDNDWALFRQIMAPNCSHAQLDAYIARLARPGALASALCWYRANTRASRFAATKPLAAQRLIQCPVLGVWSCRDSALLEPQMLASEAFVAPGCWHYARIDGVGHWMAVDAPHELNAILLAFLAVTESQGVRPKL